MPQSLASSQATLSFAYEAPFPTLPDESAQLPSALQSASVVENVSEFLKGSTDIAVMLIY